MTDEKNEVCFSAEQACCVAAVLDEIIPPSVDGKLPGAGELGVIAYVEKALKQMSVLQPVILQGLSVLEDVARRLKSESFAALSERDRLDVLEELQTVDAAFLPTLTFLAFAGYYHDGRIVEALGLEPRPPHPAGYEMPPNDFSVLEPVRRRGKVYRDV
jgi:hypothetical protein